MDYVYYKRKFPNDILVYIEEFNRIRGVIIFDFIDSSEYGAFIDLLGEEFDLSYPSMTILKNYQGKAIKENAIYSIKPNIIQTWSRLNLIDRENIDSYLIGYKIDLELAPTEVFSNSVSISDSIDIDNFNWRQVDRTRDPNISLTCQGQISVTVRDVGQGNWNEVSSQGQFKLVFDAGTSTNSTKLEVQHLVGSRNPLYESNKPHLVISHWDKDHYHCLLAMGKDTIKKNFKSFVCRDILPNLTSRILFNRILEALGSQNVFPIAAFNQDSKAKTRLKNITKPSGQIVIYNSYQHKNRNISGLVTSIKTTTGSMILSGDARYEQLSRDILAHLNYPHTHHLLVPHHGGNAGPFKYSKPSFVSFGNAIISVGKNKYGHPFETNINSLKNSGFKIVQTKLKKSDITTIL